jgi:hypothetical protein
MVAKKWTTHFQNKFFVFLPSRALLTSKLAESANTSNKNVKSDADLESYELNAKMLTKKYF